MQRRTLLTGIVGALGVSASAQQAGADDRTEAIRQNWRELLSPGFDLSDSPGPVTREAAMWRQLLKPEQFRVLREAGTERRFTSPLNSDHRPGIFVCVACELPLFSSAMKYDSGTGWPSFFTTIPGAFERKRDFLLIIPRKEYHCARCGGHHGHVFMDGPPPTNERWCNNGVALRFIPRDESV
jgi:peptide-methionine (R)-S-oxide reductase